jgi:hypothetical protein
MSEMGAEFAKVEKTLGEIRDWQLEHGNAVVKGVQEIKDELFGNGHDGLKQEFQAIKVMHSLNHPVDCPTIRVVAADVAKLTEIVEPLARMAAGGRGAWVALGTLGAAIGAVAGIALSLWAILKG